VIAFQKKMAKMMNMDDSRRVEMGLWILFTSMKFEIALIIGGQL